MKTIIILVLLTMGITLTSCKSAIPEIDNLEPTVTFLIVPVDNNQGENISIPYDFDYDNKVLYLKNLKTYMVLASTRDQADPTTMGGEKIKGSISRARFSVPLDNKIKISNFPEKLPLNWIEIPTGGSIYPETRTFSFIANPRDIRDGTSISPKMTPLVLTGGEEYKFTFTAVDHHENRTTKILKVRVSNSEAYIGDL